MSVSAPGAGIRGAGSGPRRFGGAGRLLPHRSSAAFGALCAVLAAIAAPPARAQDTGEEPVEAIVVTGTRIRQNPLEQDTPVLTLDARDLERTGLNSIGDVLQRLSISGSPLSTRFNSSGNFGFPADGGGIAAGASQVDLRHLGSKRVLVLVDGLRWVQGSSGSGVSGAADLNTIPTGMVERIEVFADGASPVYGSDAIAGVVNVVTRENFEGFAWSGRAGGYSGGGETRELELSGGKTGERFSAFLSLDYVDQAELEASKRRQSRVPKPGTGNLHGSTFTPQGRVVFSDPRTDSFVNCALDAGVTGLPVYDPDDPCGDGDDYHPWSNADRFNYAPYNLLLTPSERLGVYGQVRYQWSDALQGYAKALFNTRESVNQAAPEPLWVGDFAESGSLMDEIAIHADNPYNPFGVTLGPGETFITRRPLESGPRVFEQEVDTRYLAAGLRGEFEYAERALFWDVNLVWSRSRAEQRKSGAHNARRMLRALGPPQDCTDPCVPLNFLGGQGDGSGTITAAALEWFGFVQRDSSEQELWDFSANLSGEIFDLPAGPLAFAAGFEHREHDGEFRPDPVVEAGDTAGLAAKPTSGDFEVDEFYLEIDLPLVSERPGAERLDLSAAVRFFDYSSFGSDTAGKLGLSWRPRGDLLLRGGVSQGFRAPNIGELFGGQARFDAPIADPCSDFLNSGVSRTTVENCVAAGVPDDGSYAQIGSQISVLTGGNPRLEPETADSYTLGLVYGPGWARDLAWVEDLSLELTWYAHEIDGAITAFDAQTVLEGCYDGGVTLFCDFIDRSERGGIARFQNTLFNTGAIETSGWDLSLAYRSPRLPFGRIGLSWRNTFLSDFTEILEDLGGGTIEKRSLEGRTENDRGKPEWKSTLSLLWTSGDWSASWTLRLIDEMRERCSDFLDGTPDSLANLGVCSDPDFDDNSLSTNRLDRSVYHDLRVGYRHPVPGGHLGFDLGVNNLFDRDPPASQSALLNGYDASTYDLPGGRFAYFRLSYELD